MSAEKPLVGVTGKLETGSASREAKAINTPSLGKQVVADSKRAESKEKAVSALLARLKIEDQVADAWERLSVTSTKAAEESSEVKGTNEGKAPGLLSSLLKGSEVEDKAMMAYIQRALLSRSRGKGRRSKGLARNAVYTMELNLLTTFTASGGGVVSGSPRYGSMTSYPGFSTLSSVFARFRLVHLKVFVTLGIADSSSGTTPHELVIAADTGDTSATPSSLASAWEIPGSRIVVVANEPSGGSAGPLRPVLSFKVVPEQEWFDTATGSQKGCLPFYGLGWTATSGTVDIWLRAVVQFSGLLI
jgi:hypothetical protein